MIKKQINLFEFVKYSEFSDELKHITSKKQFSDDLENILESIWKERKRFIPSENLYYDSKSLKQRFIDFRIHEIVPRNWIGTIHFKSNGDEYVLNLLPKVFYKENHIYQENEINSIFTHILWWLSGSEKQNYSSAESRLGALKSDFLEIMVYIFSQYALEIFSSSAYHYYIPLSEDTEAVKGQIEFNSYVHNYATGNRHILPCTYDSFQYDNQFNRIVRYVSALLKDFTVNSATKKNLEELLFILDEAEYVTVTAEDCDKVVLNPVYTEMQTILDYCRLFLSSLSVYRWKDDYKVFALLIPAEKLFENFIFSILKNNSGPLIRNVSRTRPGRSYLVRQLPSVKADKYKMINDIVVRTADNTCLLLDTKYKKIYNTGKVNEENEEETDPVYNISQADIYQMVSYAVGSGINSIGLVYPAVPGEINSEIPVYEIDDEFSPGTSIRIHPFKVSIIHEEGINLVADGSLERTFARTKEKLVEELNDCIKKIQNFNHGIA